MSTKSKLTESTVSCPPYRHTWNIKFSSKDNILEWRSEAFCNVHSFTTWHAELLIERRKLQFILCHHAYGNEKVLASYSFFLHENQSYRKEIKISEENLSFNGNRKKIYLDLDHGIESLYLSPYLVITETIDKNSLKSRLPQESSLLLDVNRMWEENRFCDFVITVEEKDIPVHRLIIAGASSVFAAMLEHNMLEKSNAKIVITDYKLEVIDHLLQFIYTRKIPDFKSFSLDVCLDLLGAANKYAVTSLLSVVCLYLISILNIENVGEILLVADQLSVADLKERAFDFICRRGVKLSERKCLHKLEGKADLWKEIALRKLLN